MDQVFPSVADNPQSVTSKGRPITRQSYHLYDENVQTTFKVSSMLFSTEVFPLSRAESIVLDIPELVELQLAESEHTLHKADKMTCSLERVPQTYSPLVARLTNHTKTVNITKTLVHHTAYVIEKPAAEKPTAGPTEKIFYRGYDVDMYVLQHNMPYRIACIVNNIRVGILRFFILKHEFAGMTCSSRQIGRNIRCVGDISVAIDQFSRGYTKCKLEIYRLFLPTSNAYYINATYLFFTGYAFIDFIEGAIATIANLGNHGWFDTVRFSGFSSSCKYMFVDSIDDQVKNQTDCLSNGNRYGGGTKRYKATVTGSMIADFVVQPLDYTVDEEREYRFISYVHKRNMAEVMAKSPSAIATNIPLSVASTLMTVRERQTVAKAHGVVLNSRLSTEASINRFSHHYCPSCHDHYTILEKVKSTEEKKKDKVTTTAEWRKEHHTHSKQAEYKRKATAARAKKRKEQRYIKRHGNTESTAKFPPPPLSDDLLREIVNGFCEDMKPEMFEEQGCAVCGQLHITENMMPLPKEGLSLLQSENVTRQERRRADDPIIELPGPILANGCDNVCQHCAASIQDQQIPTQSLANGLWLGDIPAELQNLTFAEQMLIAKVRHNRCIVRVASGRAKMIANCIMFANPTARVSNVLPPSQKEMNEILAVVFIGPTYPTEDDYKRTPVLVRRNKVREALDWLKLNHEDYWDLEISYDNLNSYPLSGVPLDPEYKHVTTDWNKVASAMSKFDDQIEDGTEDGPCPFTVHGLTGEEYEKMDIKTVKIRTLQHLDKGGLSLGIGHDPSPQSMYDNPQLYPMMFPWLFPYGKGGLGQQRHKNKLSRQQHKRILLMYYDKRFQKDLYFPMIAFNEEQIKTGTTGSYLLTRRKNYKAIIERIQNLNPAVLDSIANRMAEGEKVTPQSDSEKHCFDLLNDLDYVGGFVSGSLTNKKYMRNEIWSLVAWKGAPSWFITISPADSKHPLCMYFADGEIKYKPEIRNSKERNLLVLNNPVGAARFFDFVVRLVLKHVLGVGSNHDGLYGKTAAYYGTVEQQGRLTLHLHMLLWIKSALSPQEIRDRIMSSDIEFTKELVDYLESVHCGEIMSGKASELKSKLAGSFSPVDYGVHHILKQPLQTQEVQEDTVTLRYQDPTLTLPIPMPCPCPEKHTRRSQSEDMVDDSCCFCNAYMQWLKEYNDTVDDLLVRSNMHTCRAQRIGRGNKNKKNVQVSDAKEDGADHHQTSLPEGPMGKANRNAPKGCLNKEGVCMARFPREVRDQTTVDYKDGHIFLKHGESMMNTFTRCLTYLTRCNTDVTSLLSGTSIKAVISYVTDYVTKPTLKTHQIFSAAYDVYDKASHAVLGESKPSEGARKLILKIVNSLSSKSEIGSPMASMYLLGNPDHYTSHQFVTFWWRGYVSEVARIHGSIAEPDEDDWGDDPQEKQTDCADKATQDDQEPNSDPPSQNYDNMEPVEVDDDNERVMIGKERGKYFARSNVDDYKYRPKCYSGVSLLDWIRKSKKRKRPTKDNTDNSENEIQTAAQDAEKEPVSRINDPGSSDSEWEDVQTEGRPSKYQRFSKQHPLYSTHDVHCNFEDDDDLIPNFVGGSLPRSDNGDREYYCMTMLTLFKPWRKDVQMKSPGQSWDEAFNEFVFSTDQNKLMSNFNLRYECLDSRDDYHSELKKKTNKASAQYNFNSDDSEDDDSENEEYDYTTLPTQTEKDPNRYLALSPEAHSRARNKEVISKILNYVQWPRPATTKTPISPDERINPDEILGSSGWANRVKECREQAVKHKLKHAPALSTTTQTPSENRVGQAEVKLLTPEWFCKNYKSDRVETDDIIDQVAKEFSLNKEQERAYRLIANHAATPNIEPLKMYLGGMGGTGKTQVIKAIIEMFSRKKESHRFIVLAPTGTAAALLNGSTYHSALGIRIHSAKEAGMGGQNANTIHETREKLAGVEYIFVDEVSMISCHELYAISSKLAILTNVHDKPFGGMNMVFAGDFAQLPPVKGKTLYANDIALQQVAGMSVRAQEETIGKILWQQVTTAVILKQNMRQKSQSKDDSRLRTALENMRYGACTAADIEFLRSRVGGTSIGKPDVRHPDFRNVSIITGLNIHKDTINEIGCNRFAKDTNQNLTSFYSIDRNSDEDDNNIKKRKRKSKGNQKNRQPRLDQVDKETLWNMEPSTTSHVAGTLRLCIGMPIMIRHNYATELCITKGQEGTVCGWEAYEGPDGQQCLETLFVKLIKPPQDVQIPGLPMNVVPLSRSTTTMKVTMPNGREFNIKRTQILALPNFSMTDYASQGKTRPFNVVDLGNCRTHHSYYTCLSRSASAQGTILIQGFNPKTITRGINGYLRQEFRELEILNRITELRYDEQLPDTVKGLLRNNLLDSFKSWTGSNKQNIDWHSALDYQPLERETTKRTSSDETTLLKMSLRTPIERTKKDTTPKTKPKVKVATDKKKNVPHDAKKNRFFDTSTDGPDARGTIWDSRNYSCAYDAVYTIMFNIWNQDKGRYSELFSQGTQVMQMLVHGFQQVHAKNTDLNHVRDTVRQALYAQDPRKFPLGEKYTSIDNVFAALFDNIYIGDFEDTCTICGQKDRKISNSIRTIQGIYMGNGTWRSTPRVSQLTNLTAHEVAAKCSHCTDQEQQSYLLRKPTIHMVPDIFLCEIWDRTLNFMPDVVIPVVTQQGSITLQLCGAVYGDGVHFVSRYIDNAGAVWYHDGMETGSALREENAVNIQSDTRWLTRAGDRTLTNLVYRKLAT